MTASRAARCRRTAAVEEPLDVPEIRKHPHAADRDSRTRSLSPAPVSRGCWNSVADRFHRSVAATRRNHRADSGATSAATSSDRQAHSTASLSRQEWRAEKDEHTQRDSMIAQELGGATERVERHLLVETREHARVRGLQTDGHFQLARNRIAKSQAALAIRAGEKCRMRLDDHPLESRHRRGDLLVIVRWDGGGSKKLPALYSLIWRAGGKSASAVRICAAIAPRGTVSSRVFTHKSHITHRNGHSRFVRKTTAVGARAPRLSRSSSQMDAYAR